MLIGKGVNSVDKNGHYNSVIGILVRKRRQHCLQKKGDNGSLIRKGERDQTKS